jgi:hypothetical protein
MLMRIRKRGRMPVAALFGAAISLVTIPISPRPVAACDLCAVYTATIMQESGTGVWLGLAQQFTSFGTLRSGTDKVTNGSSEWLESSITQVVIGYNVSPRWGVQLNVPFVSRRFRRAGEDGIVKDDVTGIGDASLVSHYDLVSEAYRHGIFVLRTHAGLKLATGDSDRLGRELAEHEDEEEGHGDGHGAGLGRPAHDGETHSVSGIHDHDLALGSGSIDGLVGASFLWTRDRFRLGGAVQYAVRSEGDFDYQYANDLIFSLTPGFFAALGHARSVSVGTQLSGETKGKDEQKGSDVDDSSITALYLGPRITLTEGAAVNFELGADLPVYQNASAVQIVPDYRLHLSVGVRF